MTNFHYVYILRSESYPKQTYVGMTVDLKARLAVHNAGGSPHTSKFRPWMVETAIAFTSREKATAFEAYLKTGSGHEFRHRHF
jgi:predicted GIY-YIG superfamily endonuclease